MGCVHAQTGEEVQDGYDVALAACQRTPQQFRLPWHDSTQAQSDVVHGLEQTLTPAAATVHSIVAYLPY